MKTKIAIVVLIWFILFAAANEVDNESIEKVKDRNTLSSDISMSDFISDFISDSPAQTPIMDQVVNDDNSSSGGNDTGEYKVEVIQFQGNDTIYNT